jgi:hypothetical protein
MSLPADFPCEFLSPIRNLGMARDNVLFGEHRSRIPRGHSFGDAHSREHRIARVEIAFAYRSGANSRGSPTAGCNRHKSFPRNARQ